MSSLLLRPNRQSDIPIDLTPSRVGWSHIGFRIHRLDVGAKVGDVVEPDREACVVAVQGRGQLVVDGSAHGPFGERMTPFDGLPHAVYLPPEASWEIVAGTAMEIAVCSALNRTRQHPVRVFRPQELSVETRGAGTNTRFVTNILAEGDAAAESLFVIELRTPGGHTSSYPPHKHDADALPQESALEETYYSRFDPPQGFAFQRVYTDDRSLDEALVLEDGTLSLVPRGYHPCAACHGYDLYQLCVMAGPRRIWRFTADPAHCWLTNG